MKKYIIFLYLFLSLNLFAGVVNYDYIIQKIKYYAEMAQIDPYLLQAIIKNESNYDRFAQSKNISCKGRSLGLCQLNEIYYPSWKESDFFDIDKNLYAGCKVIKECLKLSYGNIRLALIYYNFGYGNVNYKKLPIPESTKKYCNKIIIMVKQLRE